MNINLTGIVEAKKAQIMNELPGCAFRASNELRNAAIEVLGGSRSGRTYRRPGGGSYQASAPGEPPAARTGTLRNNWRPASTDISPAIETEVPYAWLDTGSPGGKIAPRPYVEKVKETAMPQIEAIYRETFK